jgi:hypothetical protein
MQSLNNKMKRYIQGWIIAFSYLASLTALPPLLADPESPLAGMERYKNLTKIQIKGNIVCLHEAMNKEFGMNIPTDHDHVYGFKTEEGTFYLFLKNNLSAAVFDDERVRDRELILSAWLFPKSNIIDIVSMKSVKDGVLHDLYYYCVICAIRSAVPGPCMCCQDDVEFVEKPLD